VNRVNSREYLGKSALIPELAELTVFESNLMRFAVDECAIEPRYLINVLQTSSLRNQILRAAKDAVNQSSINQQDVTDLMIHLPPLDLQREFVGRVEAVDKLRASHRASLAELDALFASLQHRAFRGELFA
jgi:type I restriction enzyme S subunit